MVPVVIESPYGKRVDGQPAAEAEIERNLRYLRDAMRDSLQRGEAPFASHGLYPMALDDGMPEERKLGMEAGFTWGHYAKKVIVYIDLGLTPGMLAGLERAYERSQSVEYRSLEDWRR
jgi:hypothetical protein